MNVILISLCLFTLRLIYMLYCKCFKQDKFFKSVVVDLVTVLTENMKNIDRLID